MPPTDYGQLSIQRDNKIQRTTRLTSSVTTLGRSQDRTVVLADPTVSARHAEIRVETSGLLLTDTGSRNGTIVAGRRIPANQPVPLTDGLIFRIGPFYIRYRAVAAEDEAIAKPADQDVKAETGPHIPGKEDQPKEPEVFFFVDPELDEASNDKAEIGQVGLRATEQRESFDLPTPIPGRSIYLKYLPVIFHNEPFLGRFLQLMESLWEPREQRQDHIDMYFALHTCPASFLPWIASWLGMSFNAHWPEARRRRLVAQAMHLYRWRGTPEGLRQMIEVCTDLTPDIQEDPTQPFTFHIRVAIPPGSDVTRELIEELVQTHKPAYSGYTLEIGN